MPTNLQEEMIYALLTLAITVAFFLAGRGRRAENKIRREQGKQHGYETAGVLGPEKAFKIAEQLPDCPYRDGYVEGVAEMEDTMRRNL